MQAYQSAGFAYQGSGLFAYQTGVSVIPTNIGGGGGGGSIGYRPRYRVIYPKRGKHIDKKIGEWLEEIVSSEPAPEVVEIRKVVAPYVRKDTIDLAEMQRDARQIRVLLQAYEANVRRMLDEEDDELLMMIL